MWAFRISKKIVPDEQNLNCKHLKLLNLNNVLNECRVVSNLNVQVLDNCLVSCTVCHVTYSSPPAVHGLVELVWLPYQQYREDGRIVWGLTRGATAFTSSTGVAVVELSSRLLQSVQSVAQMAYDMVTPTECPSQALVHQRKPHQPQDFREGFANAYDVVSAVSYILLLHF